MVTTVPAEQAATRSRTRTILTLVTAAVIAVAANTVVAAVAVATGAPATYGPLTFPAYGLFTVIGVALGWFGWSLVQRKARDPRRTLTILVPAVTVASFLPDVLLLVLGFIPGTTTGAVIALMVMHLVVVAVAVPAYAFASRIR
ncbi:DUF6069 family protein [Microbacterium sp. GCS4]|uniref:DUF6069 family protein n=1 Tax=Microbacterium sp. GCS4 TaxID=1692239 RepID=UPI00067FFE06|nr:DUF6069 family protein [Microbacterium sp. GCS4]KNY04017.1 hypothetical protein AKH00_16710 [Microbacterium sp. GCS4]